MAADKKTIVKDNKAVVKPDKKKNTATPKGKKKTASKAGRKSKYYTHVQPNLERIKKMRQLGETEEQIIKKLGVGISTWYEYRKKYPELMEVLKTSKELLIQDLSNSLFRQGLGGIKIKKTKILSKVIDGEKTIEKIEETIEELPPNVAANIYALNNLDPERWKNRYREEISVDGDAEAINIHQKTIAALQNRKVAGFNDDDKKDEVNNG